MILSLCLLVGTMAGMTLTASAETWDGSVATEFAGGSGTESDPYQIATGAQLAYFASLINGSSNSTYCSSYYVLTADIDLGGRSWTPIGNGGSKYFKGVFDGAGHTISNLYVSTTGFGGLFGMTSGATIKSVTLSNCNITGAIYAGGIVGYSDSSVVRGCTVSGSVACVQNSTSVCRVGGIVGNGNSTSIIECVNNASVTASDSGSGQIWIGGLAGYISSGAISSSINAGNVTILSYSGSFAYAGGLTGGMSSLTVSNSYNTGSITADLSSASSVYAGGLFGQTATTSTITNCYNTGSVTAVAKTLTFAGGLVGDNQGGVTISYTYNAGNVSGTAGSSVSVGGLVGSNYSSITYSHNVGTVSGSGNTTAYVGGVVGNGSNSTGSIGANVYYLSTSASVGVGRVGSGSPVSKTAEEFASGEVAYLLNGSISGGSPWYQTIGADSYPIFDSTHGTVYASTSCIGTVASYNNVGASSSHSNLVYYAAKAPTCAEDGNIEYWYCSDCGKYFSDSAASVEITDTTTIAIPATRNHTYDTGTVTKEATCTEDGVITYTCTVCGDSYTEVIPATGHSYGEPVFTWESDYSGATATFTCDNDSSHTEVLTATVSSVTTDAKCTTDGKTVYTATVTFENTEYTATQTVAIQATGHTTEIQNAKDATCGEEGYTGDEVCTVCGETITVGTVIAATGNHTYDAGTVTKEATCTEEGEMTYTCTVCGDSYTEAIFATGHSYGTPVFTWESDYTCTATFTCDNDSKHVETVDCDIATRVVDSCVTVQVTYYTASVTFNGTTYTCDETKSAVTGDKVEHNFTEHHEAVDPTCTEYGYYEYWYCDTCSRFYIEVNGVKQETSIIVIGATGHSMTHVESKDATCTEEGNIEYWHCANCDKYFSDEDGNNEITDTSTITIGALGHNLTHVGDVAATCTADGNTEYWYCETCKKYFSDENATTEIDLADTVVTASGHTYGKPVFTWNGNTCTATFTCSCGDTQTVDATVTSKNFLGVVTYTAKVEFENETYTATKTAGRSLLTIMADYTSVNNAISKANALNASDYSNFADVTAAINAVQWNLNVLNQSTVNGYAEAIETAIANLKAVELTEETVTINEPIEDTNTETEPDDIEVDDTDEDQNPTTGIALAVLPMAVALAATVANKRG